jgi:hypothetical protein
MRLDGEKYKSKITEMLDDARAGIVKTARDLVMKTGLPDFEKVKEIFTDTAYMNTKLKCLDILFTAPKWPGIIYMLEAASYDDRQIREKSVDAIDRWLFRFNRSFVLPTPNQAEYIKELIRARGKVLSPKKEKELLFLLQ